MLRRVVVDPKQTPSASPSERYDLRTMMTPTTERLQLRAKRHLATRAKWWPT